MALEVEAKFLHIDPQDISQKLEARGAEFLGEQLFSSTTFDFPGFPLDKKAAWIRLRKEGDRVKLAYKQRLARLKSWELNRRTSTSVRPRKCMSSPASAIRIL
ncbi:CYTH domain-containing protein [Candidatus Kaiserbacteria bacterium]|nr:CYTH domain-containing protein [Candidatus Kaiserbacteria bacterium]